MEIKEPKNLSQAIAILQYLESRKVGRRKLEAALEDVTKHLEGRAMPKAKKGFTFDKHIYSISDNIGLLANDFQRLHQMKDEILNYTNDSEANRMIFFASIGHLQRKINKLLDILGSENNSTIASPKLE